MVLDLKKSDFWTNDELGFFYILADAVHSVPDPEELFFMLLTAATAGSGLNFSRAAILLRDERSCLVGKMGIGPASGEEAGKVWRELSERNVSLAELFSGYSEFLKGSDFNRKIAAIVIPPEECGICGRVLEDGETYLLTDPFENGLVPAALESVMTSPQLAVTPIPGRFENIGVLVGGNAFSGRKVNEHQAQLLAFLALSASSIIERAKMNRDLNDRLEELQSAYQTLYETRHRLLSSEHLASIGQAIACVSHEIREPLSSIGGLARVIGRSCGENRDVKVQSELIYQKVVQLNRFVNRNLAFARLGEQVREPASIVELVDSVTAGLLGEMAAEGRPPVEIERRLDPDTPPVLIDAEQMKHALGNVLENSVFFVTGRPDGKVVLTSEWDDRFVRVTISDNGVGIARADLDKVFEPFFTTRSGGTGLGLPFARQIVEAAGGKIAVESEGKGEGTVFTIFLPRSL